MTLILTALIAAPQAFAHSEPSPGGTPNERIEFLQDRITHHRYVCKNGAKIKRTRWHCRAISWTLREHRQAERDKARYDNAVAEWPWQALGRCENRGDGLYGINWDAYNSTYEGAYGFLHSTWDQFRYDGMPESANLATPREQTKVAMRLRATFGGYSSWPACSIRLGLRRP